MERDFKTTIEQWKVVVQWLEENPILIKSKFSNFDGDSGDTKKVWQNMADQLNSMGMGMRSVEKWKAAIGRWKSKTKAKTSLIQIENQRTGGGPRKAVLLNSIEERLMAVMGWKAVTGDYNRELGLQPISTQSPEIAGPSSLSLPPLIPLNTKSEHATITAASPPHESLQSDIDETPRQGSKRKMPSKIRHTTEKTRRMVNLNRMHAEQMSLMRTAAENTTDMTNSLRDIRDDIRRAVDHMTRH